MRSGAPRAQDAARKLGYILLTANTNNDAELEDQEISALRRYNVDGFLYAMMYHRKVDIPEILEGSLTVVVDGEDAAGRFLQSTLMTMAGHDATNRLIQAGCRRIVYYGSTTTIIAQGSVWMAIGVRACRKLALHSMRRWSSMY